MIRKRTYDDQNQQNKNEIQVLSNLAALHGYHFMQTPDERIFGPPHNITNLNLDFNNEIFLYNIPIDCYEDKLLPLLFKAGPIYTLRFFPNYKHNCRSYAFVKYFEKECVQYACNLLNGCEISAGCKLIANKCTNDNKLFIANIKLEKVGFYYIQAKLIDLLQGLKTVTFYSASKYGRYSIVLEFFRYCDMELGRRVLICDKLFQYYTEIIIDCCFRCGPRTDPAVIYTWEAYGDSAEKHPKITIIDKTQARYLQCF